MVSNMTEGRPLRLILGFALPMLVGNIFQQVYNVVDASVVGHCVGPNALAAVGATGGVTMFLVALMMGLTNGAGIIIAQCFGSKNFISMKKAVVALIYIVGVLTVVTSVAGVFFSESVLKVLGTPPEVLAEAKGYMQVQFAFMAGTALYNTCGAILRSIGDSKTPLYVLIIASVINVALDLLFVVKFHWGVVGAAYATVISQSFSAVLCAFYIFHRRRQLNLDGLAWRVNGIMVKKIFQTGIPAALESCLISLGTMSVQSLVNSFGAMTIAAYTAATRIDAIAIAPIVSVGSALSVFTGQNIGAGKIERIKKGLKQTLGVMLVVCAVLAVGILIFKRQLLSLFLNPAEAAEAIQIGSTYLSIIGIAYMIAAVMRSYLNVIRGAGDVNSSALAGIMELGGRILFAYLLVRPFGATGIWIATPLAWAMGASVPVIRYYSGKWKTKKLV